jgi:hypothetical protein
MSMGLHLPSLHIIYPFPAEVNVKVKVIEVKVKVIEVKVKVIEVKGKVVE